MTIFGAHKYAPKMQTVGTSERTFGAEQLFLERKSNVEAAATLLQAPSVSVDHLVVMGDIEEQGWMELARALRSRPDDDVIIEKLFCSRETIQKAKQDDFKVIWDRTIVCVGILHKASSPLQRFTRQVPKSNEWEQDWERLNQILGLSQDQFFVSFWSKTRGEQ